MRKFYKKINWLINGAFIGLIIGGVITRDFNTMLLSVAIGMALAIILKIIVWYRSRSLY